MQSAEQGTGQKTVAVLGASRHRAKFGNKCVRAYLQMGWSVIPINSLAETVEGLPAVRSLEALGKQPLDRLSVYLPPQQTDRELEGIARLAVAEVWFNPGATNRSVTERARSLGIPVVEGCSIVDIGASPADFF